MTFNAHGRFTINAEQNIIIVDAEGPYNDELMNAYKARYKAVMGEVCSQYKEWSQIIFMHNESIMTPEAEAELIELNKIKRKNGLTHSAIVLIDIEHPIVLKAQFKHVCDECNIIVEFFHNKYDAKMWLLKESNPDKD
jgi:hypothetical protein